MKVRLVLTAMVLAAALGLGNSFSLGLAEVSTAEAATLIGGACTGVEKVACEISPRCPVWSCWKKKPVDPTELRIIPVVTQIQCDGTSGHCGARWQVLDPSCNRQPGTP